MKGVADCRVSTGLVSHPKKLKLQRRLGKPAVWSLIALWSFTASNKPDGSLAGMTAEDIAIAADWDGDADQFVSTLLELRFLDGEQGDLRVHDWSENNPWAAGATRRSEAARAAAMTKHHGASAQRMQTASDSHADRSAELIAQSADRMPGACAEQPEPSNPQCPVSVSVSVSVPASEALPFPEQQQPTSSAAEPQMRTDREVIYNLGKPLLTSRGENEKAAGNFLGKLVKDYGEVAAARAVSDAVKDPPVEPKSHLVATAARFARESEAKAATKPNGRRNPAHIGAQDYSETWGSTS